MKTIRYWYKNRYVGKWNKIEDPNMSTHNFYYLISDKMKNKPSSTSGVGKTGCPQIEDRIRLYLTHYTRANSNQLTT